MARVVGVEGTHLLGPRLACKDPFSPTRHQAPHPLESSQHEERDNNNNEEKDDKNRDKYKGGDEVSRENGSTVQGGVEDGQKPDRGCALRPDGTLKDASEIVWHYNKDDDDDDIIPSLSGPSSKWKNDGKGELFFLLFLPVPLLTSSLHFLGSSTPPKDNFDGTSSPSLTRELDVPSSSVFSLSLTFPPLNQQQQRGRSNASSGGDNSSMCLSFIHFSLFPNTCISCFHIQQSVTENPLQTLPPVHKTYSSHLSFLLIFPIPLSSHLDLCPQKLLRAATASHRVYRETGDAAADAPMSVPHPMQSRRPDRKKKVGEGSSRNSSHNYSKKPDLAALGDDAYDMLA